MLSTLSHPEKRSARAMLLLYAPTDERIFGIRQRGSESIVTQQLGYDNDRPLLARCGN